MSKEAMKLAELVEASMEECMGDDGMVAVIPLDLYNELIESLAAIREALADQPAQQQEPVAWMTYESKRRLSNGGNCKGAVPVHKNPSSASCVPLYTAPQPRREVELTDEEIMDAVRDVCAAFRWPSSALFIARSVIAAYKAKQGETNGNG